MIFIQVLRSWPKKVMLMVLVYRIIIYVKISDDIRYARNSGWVQALLAWQPPKKIRGLDPETLLFDVWNPWKPVSFPNMFGWRFWKQDQTQMRQIWCINPQPFQDGGILRLPPRAQIVAENLLEHDNIAWYRPKMVYWFSLFSLKFRVKMLTRTR